MPFNTKFTPSQYQDRDQYNEHVLNERYATVKALRESYSHIYQELTNLRNNLQDYKAEQDNQPELATSEADRIRYNNEIENRYLALKSIQLNTSYANEYGHTVRPFNENKAAEQLRLHCNYMISGSHHFKQYHLAKTSCIELNQDATGETIPEFDNAGNNMSVSTVTVTNAVEGTAKVLTFQSNTAAGVITMAAVHGLEVGQKVKVHTADLDACPLLKEGSEFYVNTVPSDVTFTLSETVNGDTVQYAGTSAGVKLRVFGDSSESVVVTVSDNAVTLSDNVTSFAADTLINHQVTLTGFEGQYSIFNNQQVTITDNTAGASGSAGTITFAIDAYELTSTAYAAGTNKGFVKGITSAISFPFKKFYMNKLDATDSSAVYGNGIQKFSYSDNYATSLDTLEGHIYLLNNGVVELDGRQSASVLGRNVQNLENMIEIIANNANATEQALDRIVQIAELVGIEINHA